MSLKIWVLLLVGTNFCVAQRRAANADIPLNARQPNRELRRNTSSYQPGVGSDNSTNHFKGASHPDGSRSQSSKGYSTSSPSRESSPKGGHNYDPTTIVNADNSRRIAGSSVGETDLTRVKGDPSDRQGYRSDLYPVRDTFERSNSKSESTSSRVLPKEESTSYSRNSRPSQRTNPSEDQYFNNRPKIDDYQPRLSPPPDSDQSRFDPSMTDRDEGKINTDRYSNSDRSGQYDQRESHAIPDREGDRSRQGSIPQSDSYDANRDSRYEYWNKESSIKGSVRDEGSNSRTHQLPKASNEDRPLTDTYSRSDTYENSRTPGAVLEKDIYNRGLSPSRSVDYETSGINSERSRHEERRRRPPEDERSSEKGVTDRRGGERVPVYDRDRYDYRDEDDSRVRNRRPTEAEINKPATERVERIPIREESYPLKTPYRGNPATYDETSPTGILRPDNLPDKGYSGIRITDTVGESAVNRPLSRDSGETFPVPPPVTNRDRAYPNLSATQGDNKSNTSSNRHDYRGRDQIETRKPDSDSHSSRVLEDSAPFLPSEERSRRPIYRPEYERDEKSVPSRSRDFYDDNYRRQSGTSRQEERDRDNSPTRDCGYSNRRETGSLARPDDCSDQRQTQTYRPENDREPSLPRNTDLRNTREQSSRSSDDAYERRPHSSVNDRFRPPSRYSDTYDREVTSTRRREEDYEREPLPVRRREDTYERKGSIGSTRDTYDRDLSSYRRSEDPYERNSPSRLSVDAYERRLNPPNRPEDSSDREFPPERGSESEYDKKVSFRDFDDAYRTGPSRSGTTYNRESLPDRTLDDTYNKGSSPTRKVNDGYDRAYPASRRSDDTYDREFPASSSSEDAYNRGSSPDHRSEEAYNRRVSTARRSQDADDRGQSSYRRTDDNYGRELQPPPRSEDSYNRESSSRRLDDMYDRPLLPSRRNVDAYDRGSSSDHRVEDFYDRKLPPPRRREEDYVRRISPPLSDEDAYNRRRSSTRSDEDDYRREVPPRRYEQTEDRSLSSHRSSEDSYDKRIPQSRRYEDTREREPGPRRHSTSSRTDDVYERTEVRAYDRSDERLSVSKPPARSSEETYDRRPLPSHRFEEDGERKFPSSVSVRTEDTYERKPEVRTSERSSDRQPIPENISNKAPPPSFRHSEEDFNEKPPLAHRRENDRDNNSSRTEDNYNKRFPTSLRSDDGYREVVPPSRRSDKESEVGTGHSYDKENQPAPRIDNSERTPSSVSTSHDIYNGKASPDQQNERNQTERRSEVSPNTDNSPSKDASRVILSLNSGGTIRNQESLPDRSPGISHVTPVSRSSISSTKASQERGHFNDGFRGSPDTRHNTTYITLKGDPDQRKTSEERTVSSIKGSRGTLTPQPNKGLSSTSSFVPRKDTEQSESHRGVRDSSSQTNGNDGLVRQENKDTDHRSLVPVFKSPKEIIDSELHLRNPSPQPSRTVTEVHYPVFIPRKGEDEVVIQPKDRRGTTKDT